MYKKNLALGIIFLGVLCGGLHRHKLDTIRSQDLVDCLEKAHFDETQIEDLKLLKDVVSDHIARPGNKFNPAIRNKLTSILGKITEALSDPSTRFQHRGTQTNEEQAEACIQTDIAAPSYACYICREELLGSEDNNIPAWNLCPHHIKMHMRCIASHFTSKDFPSCPYCRVRPYTYEEMQYNGWNSTIYYPTHFSRCLESHEEFNHLLEELPRLRYLESLDITTTLMNFENLRRLAQLLPELHNLTSLKIVFHNHEFEAGAIVLLAQNMPPQLRELSLSNCLISTYDMRKLAPSLPRELTHLSLCSNNIDARGVAELIVDLPEFHDLALLNLCGNNISNAMRESIQGIVPDGCDVIFE